MVKMECPQYCQTDGEMVFLLTSRLCFCCRCVQFGVLPYEEAKRVHAKVLKRKKKGTMPSTPTSSNTKVKVKKESGKI